MQATDVSLVGTASAPDGDTLSYLWEQISGASVTLTTPSELTAGFTATEVGSYEFSFTATDPLNVQSSDNVIVTVTAQVNRAPDVNAGSDVTADVGTTINLEGTVSDLDGDSVTYLWQQTSGFSVTLSSTTDLETSFLGSTAGVSSFRLTATDSEGASSSDIVNVTLNSVAEPPVTSSGGGGGSLSLMVLLSYVFVGLLARGRRSIR